MTILNLMLGKKRGGLEQAMLDYAEALAEAGIASLSVISPTAWVEAPLVTAGLAHQSLSNFGGWDPFAARALRKLAAQQQARAIICHGNRALKLALKACKGRVPVIAVAHNTNTALFLHADACFGVSAHIAAHLAKSSLPNVTLMPNMVRIPPHTKRPPYRTPPVIGAMGRLIPKKGFDVFIEALALLRARGVAFHAVLGGEGEQLATLETLIAAHGLDAQVTLPGWVSDHHAFYAQLDCFVLPSRIEAFGLVLTEAMAHQVPVITSDAEGPMSIVHDGVDAVVTPRGDAAALADAIAALLRDPARGRALGEAGRALVERHYTKQAMAARLKAALRPYMVA